MATKKPVVEPARAKDKAILTEIEIVSADAVEDLVLPDFYRTDSKAPDGVEIGCVGETFQWLMATVTKPINVSAGELRISRLEQWATTNQIVNAVDPERRFESFAEAAAEMSVMLRRQPKGKPGTLRTDSGYPTLFVFSRGVVDCGWYYGYRGWYVEAHPIMIPRGWLRYLQVISH